MSAGDEMVFGDVQYREPVRATRPDLDRKLACVAYEVPGPLDLPIFLERKAADAIERHALRDTSVELGGILLGQECIDVATGRPFVRVTESIEAKHYENTQASFTYTHDSWEEISRERDRLHPELDIVGWYHTHPDFGIFLSSHDLFIHRNFFAQPLQVAYVVDPIRQTRGFFQWRDDRLDQVGGFYLTADRSERLALARLANDLESIPHGEAGGGGGALSPRLEAELIAMLSRPHQAASSSIDRAQAAATFGALGMFAGLLLAVALAGLYMIQQNIARQGEVLDSLRRKVDLSEEKQLVAFDLLASRGDPSAGSLTLQENQAKLIRERDKLKGQVEDASTANHSLAAEARRLEGDLGKNTEKMNEATKELNELRAQVVEQKDEIALLKRSPEAQASRRYDIVWYTALIGWIAAILSGLGLIANLAARTPPPSPAPIVSPLPSGTNPVIVPPPGRTEGMTTRGLYTPEEPPHSIT